MNVSSGAAADRGDCVVVRFSTADYAPGERLTACREIYGRTLSRREIEPLSAEPFHTEATLWRLPGLGVVTARRSPAIYRLPRQFIDSDDVFVTIGLTSGYEAQHLGRRLELQPGEASVMTASEPAALKVPCCGDFINVRAPRRTRVAVVLEDTAGRGHRTLAPEGNGYFSGAVAKAGPGTVRKDFGTDVEKNAAHGSDAPETAAQEIAFFFPGTDLA